MINCIIIEDEHGAQEVLENYVDKTPFLHCKGIYESGLDIDSKQLEEIDFIFLDIQLPELNGLSFLRTLVNPPKVIITTAYPDYAVEAFEEAVIDYLVKPFSYERFFKAVNRIQDKNIEKKEHIKQFFLYADKTIYNIHVDDVCLLKGEVDYVKVVTNHKNILILDTLRNWEEKLQNFNFIRIHRSYIINMDKIEKVSGNQVFIGDIVIPIGKTYKNTFLKLINY
ncbi:LytTR family DNA-binding domain-containing protein [uncultured Aquimarina sp.]|uniref:LytR/AlgR family response regulator transcription factor n=1 Tax=uncultured Aquimarina sp. TaxID=575652 RepID=UPI0026139B46|nr:LytTR family DNA-binding domain-containing protein [uncultured Aquimarina sp.]